MTILQAITESNQSYAFVDPSELPSVWELEGYDLKNEYASRANLLQVIDFKLGEQAIVGFNVGDRQDPKIVELTRDVTSEAKSVSLKFPFKTSTGVAGTVETFTTHKAHPNVTFFAHQLFLGRSTVEKRSHPEPFDTVIDFTITQALGKIFGPRNLQTS